MNEASSQDGVIVAIIDRFEKFRLPRALDIKAKVERGECLDDSDIEHLKQVITTPRTSSASSISGRISNRSIRGRSRSIRRSPARHWKTSRVDGGAMAVPPGATASAGDVGARFGRACIWTPPARLRLGRRSVRQR